MKILVTTQEQGAVGGGRQLMVEVSRVPNEGETLTMNGQQYLVQRVNHALGGGDYEAEVLVAMAGQGQGQGGLGGLGGRRRGGMAGGAATTSADDDEQLGSLTRGELRQLIREEVRAMMQEFRAEFQQRRAQRGRGRFGF